MTSPNAPNRFEGAVVLITGAGRGIGRSSALQFAREGARVAVLDRDGESAEQVVREIVDTRGAAFPIAADLGDPTARAGVIEDVLAECSGRLDVLVNNAAIHGPRRPLMDLSDADVRNVMEVDLFAPMLLCRDALPHLVKTRGAIVMISSIQAALPLATFASYVAAKGGLEALTRALAVEMAPSGVRVNAVAPGAVESPAMHEQWKQSGITSPPRAPTLLGRWGTNDDIAAAVTFLASRAAEFIAGEVVRVDGGRQLSRDADPLDINR